MIPDPTLFDRMNAIVTREAPLFMKRVETAKANDQPLTLALEEVDDNPLLLYACVWLSTLNGVPVFVPADPRTTPSIQAKAKKDPA